MTVVPRLPSLKPLTLARALSRWCVMGSLVWAALGTFPSTAQAATHTEARGAARPSGRPKVVLDRLTLPETLADSASHAKTLRLVLAKEAKRADWGAGRDSTITYRFRVEELSISVRGDLVRVRCTARGHLPRGKSARSYLEFSGAASEQRAVVDRVLQIVARGVVTRLAELERIRRGQLAPARVAKPDAAER